MKMPCSEVMDGDNLTLFVNTKAPSTFDPAGEIAYLAQTYRVVAIKGLDDVLVLVPLSSKPVRLCGDESEERVAQLLSAQLSEPKVYD